MEKVYVLDIRVPNRDNRRIEVIDELQLGSGEQCEVRILDHGLSPLQGRFRVQNKILTFTHLGPEDSFKIDGQKCGHGRMYILSKGDKCTIEKVKIIIREEKAEPPPPSDEEDIPEVKAQPDHEILDEPTNPAIIDSDSESAGEGESAGAGAGANEDEDEDEDFEYVDEEVYVDEDGNETEAPPKEKKPGIFSRLFKRGAKAKPKKGDKGSSPQRNKDRFDLKLKGKGKKKKAPMLGIHIAGPLSRFFGLLYSLFFFSLFMNFLLPSLERWGEIKILPLSQEVWPKLEIYLAKLPEELPSQLKELPYATEAYTNLKELILTPETFHYIFFFLIFELIFQLLLGLPLGHFLIGIKNRGHTLISRLLSPLRIVLGWLLLPLLIFDIPILMRKRSFKEIITLSRYSIRNRKMTFMLSIFGIPLVTTALLNTQILLDYNKAPSQVEMNRVKLPPFRAKPNEVEFSYKSAAFGIAGKTSLDPAIYFIPGVTFQKSNTLPLLTIYDPKKGKSLMLSHRENALSLEELLNICQADPLFPYLHHNLKESPNNLLSFFYQILTIVPQKAYLKVQELGPFLGPYYSAAKLLRNKLGGDELTTITLFEEKDKTLLQSQSLKNHHQLKFIQLEEEKESLGILTFSSDTKSKDFNSQMVGKIILRSNPFKGDYKSVVSMAKKQGDPRTLAFVVQDILNQIIQKKSISQQESQITTNFFLQVGRGFLRQESDFSQAQLIEHFKKLDKALQRVNTKGKNHILNKLRLTLNRIQKALAQKDSRFFKLNK